MSLSFWLEPQGETNEKYSKIIKELSQRFGTPEFNPHVTLISPVKGSLDDISQKSAELIKAIKPFEIALSGEVVCEEVWSRALIILAEKTPQLMEANGLAREAFGVEADPYLPHLSLMYTKTVPVDKEIRLKLARELDPEELKGTFLVNQISLLDANENIEQWKKIQDFPLSQVV